MAAFLRTLSSIVPTLEGARPGGAERQRDLVRAICAAAWIAGFVLAMTPYGASAQSLGPEQAEALVSQLWFEGLPEEEAARIGPEGATRLVEMLTDPAERRSHANILLALGLCGQPGAFEAIRDWADTPREGGIDRDTFRAWQVLPFALGHLARHDRRALSRLETRLEGGAPSWHFRHHRGARLASQSRHAAARSLALTSLPAARAALDRAGLDASDPEFAAHLEAMRELHAQRVRERVR